MQFEEAVYRDQLYTAQQSRLLTNLPRLTAPLSILGSSVIIYIILKDRRRKLGHVYHQVLLAYSSIDVLCSSNLALSALVVPRGTPGVWGAQGTVATCEASGFITQFSLSLGVYACFICLYYVLVLRYHVLEATLAYYVEPWVHAFALITPLVLGSIMLWQGNYNPTNVIIGWCFINVYPMDCLRNDSIECQRGAGYEAWLFANNIPFFVFFTVVLASSVLTFLTVRNLEQRSNRWSFSNIPSRASTRRVRETATQASLYIIAFSCTYLFFGIGTLFGPYPANKANRDFYLPVVILTKITFPLQGLWNCIIYIRPRYNALRQRNPDLSCWTVFKLVLASRDARKNNSHDGIDGSSSPSVPLSAFGALANWIYANNVLVLPRRADGLSGSSRETSSKKSDEIIFEDPNLDGEIANISSAVGGESRQSEVEHDDFCPEFDCDTIIISPFDGNENEGERKEDTRGNSERADIGSSGMLIAEEESKIERCQHLH